MTGPASTARGGDRIAGAGAQVGRFAAACPIEGIILQGVDQGGAQLGEAGEAVLGFLRQATRDQLGDGLGTVGNQGAEIGRGFVAMLEQDLDRGPTMERRLAGDEVEQGGANRVQIGVEVEIAFAACLLRRHVEGGAQDHPGHGQTGALFIDRAAETEIHDLDRTQDPALDVDHDIGWFDVAMDDVGQGEGVIQRSGHLQADPDG